MFRITCKGIRFFAFASLLLLCFSCTEKKEEPIRPHRTCSELRAELNPYYLDCGKRIMDPITLIGDSFDFGNRKFPFNSNIVTLRNNLCLGDVHFLSITYYMRPGYTYKKGSTTVSSIYSPYANGVYTGYKPCNESDFVDGHIWLVQADDFKYDSLNNRVYAADTASCLLGNVICEDQLIDSVKTSITLNLDLEDLNGDGLYDKSDFDLMFDSIVIHNEYALTQIMQ